MEGLKRDPRIDKNYIEHEKSQRDKEALLYDSFLSEYQHHVEWESIYRKFNFQKGDLVLDAGCGTGRFSEKLAALGHRVVGVDFSEESLKVARRRADPEMAEFHLANLLNMPFGSSIFDKVLCSQVIEHILSYEDAIRLLKELKRVLKPGGELIITTFNYTLIDRLLRKKVKADFKGTNFIRYTRQEFHNLLLEVFSKGELKRICGILNLRLRPLEVGPRCWRFGKSVILKLDLCLERTLVSPLLGHLLLAQIVKIHKSDEKG